MQFVSKSTRYFFTSTFLFFTTCFSSQQIYEKQLYGTLYKVNAGNFQAIAVNSVDLVEELLRKDEKFPSRGDMTLWTEYRDMKGIGYGPFTE